MKPEPASKGTTADARAYVPLLAGSLLFAAVSFFLLDIPVAGFFRQFRDAPWMGFWEAVTRAGQSEWYLVGGLAAWLLFRRRNLRASRGGLFLFGSVAASGLGVDLLKALLGRARPHLQLEQGIYGFDGLHIEHGWTSFPSGHSATAFSVAVALALLFPRFRLPFLAAGLLIAVSRVVLCQHYPGDIAVGSAIGAATSLFLYKRYFKTPPDEA
jgi:membrane-associated phospholipid phosphatase